VGVGGPPGLAASGPGAPAGMYPDYFTSGMAERDREMREREREREPRDRDRDGRDRDRGDRVRDRERERAGAGGVIVDRDVIMRDPREQQQRDARMAGSIPVGMGMNAMGAGPSGPVPVMSDREREIRDRDRDRLDRERLGERDHRDRDRDRGLDRSERERERERLADAREPKRLKSERDRGVKPLSSTTGVVSGGDRPGPSDHFSPSMGHAHHTPKLPPHPPATGLVGGGPPPPGMGGPGLPPQQPGQVPGGVYTPAEGNSLGLIPLSGPGASGPSSNPSANPASSSQALVPSQPPSAMPSFPDDIDIHTIPPEYKHEGSDWFALFNHKVKRVLDVNLVHTLMHESVVCCVRFSADGKYLATGCNRTAQIYDAKTGLKTW
jgi:glucose repression regulatory protein TUP1